MGPDRDDVRGQLHAAHLLNAWAEDGLEESDIEALWPVYFREPEPEPEIDDETKSRQIAAMIFQNYG